VKALARAVITGDEELVVLKDRLFELEKENEALRSWKQQRIKMEEALPRLALADLKEMARECDIGVGGTKMQLLIRLIEAGIIKL
jgi:hypothetical protein